MLTSLKRIGSVSLPCILSDCVQKRERSASSSWDRILDVLPTFCSQQPAKMIQMKLGNCTFCVLLWFSNGWSICSDILQFPYINMMVVVQGDVSEGRQVATTERCLNDSVPFRYKFPDMVLCSGACIVHRIVWRCLNDAWDCDLVRFAHFTNPKNHDKGKSTCSTYITNIYIYIYIWYIRIHIIYIIT